MHWTCDSIRIGQIKVYDPCPYGSTIWSPIDSFGHATLKIKGVLPGSYEIWYRILLDSSQVADLSYYVYYNEVLKDEGNYRLIGPGRGQIAQYFSNISTPYANDFDVQGESSPLCFSFNRSVGMCASNSCTCDGAWTCDSEPVYYNIVSEAEYVSFYNGDNEIGSSYSASYPQGSSIGIRQKKLCTDTVDRYADISITWRNITKHTSVLINRLAPAVNFYTNDDYIPSGNTTWGVISLDNPEASYRLRAAAPGICNYNVSANATYKVEILTGGQYINLIDPTQDGEYKTIDALAQQDGNAEFQITADGTAPLQPVTATIRVSSSDANIKDSIRTIVINPAPIRAIVDPPMIGAGDTATITMQQLNTNGEYVDFPDDQQYEVGMAEGCVWGDIVAKPSGGEFTKNSYFASVVKPIMFVAADSLEDDGGTVKLDIGIVEPSNEKIKHKTMDTSWQRIKAELEKFYAAKRGNNRAKIKKVQDGTCHNGGLNSDEKTEATVQTNNGIEILSPNKESKDEYISRDPVMPAVLCQARLKNNIAGPIKFEWDYIIYHTIKRRDRGKNHPIKTLCDRWSRFEFHGISYVNDSKYITSWNVSFLLDSMKSMLVKAPVPWRFIRSGNNNIYSPQYPAGNCDKVVTHWDTDEWLSSGDDKSINERLITGSNIFTGGDVEIVITAKDVNQRIVGFGHIKANKIRGLNPYPDQIINASNDPSVKAVMKTESSKFQFYPLDYEDTTLSGTPKYGPPNGFGLMQIDNSPTPHEADLWNWRQNIADGIMRYYSGYEAALKYTRGFNRPYSDDIVRMNAWQNYNQGGHNFYYYYDKDTQKWEICQYIKDDPDRDYAGRVLKNYIP
jgi:hypothetical protein